MADSSILGYVTGAGMIVKIVMLLLLIASIVSWTIIFQRKMLLASAKRALNNFEEKFWSGIDLTKLFTELNHQQENRGMANIFVAGFKEFVRLRKQNSSNANVTLEGAQRAMRIANSREMENLNQNLQTLATIGSTSPYVGLFGTVWGIMTTFHALALGAGQQASIALVAPGISEALIATAMGLFAAIPAVIAYNYYANEVEQIQNQYDTFQEEFSTILHRQAHAQIHTAVGA